MTSPAFIKEKLTKDERTYIQVVASTGVWAGAFLVYLVTVIIPFLRQIEMPFPIETMTSWQFLGLGGVFGVYVVIAIWRKIIIKKLSEVKESA